MKNRSTILKLITIAVIIVGTYLFINKIFEYVAPFVIGYIISLIMEPLVKLIVTKNKLPRWFAALVCVLMIIALLGVVGTGVVLKLIDEGGAFIAGIPFYVQDIAAAFESLTEAFNDQFIFIPDSMYSLLDGAGQSLVSGLTDSLGAGVKHGSINIVASLPNMVMGLLLTIISAFFFIKDKHIIRHFIKLRSPSWLQEMSKAMKDGFINVINGYFKAQLILMSITAVICITGLLVLKYPYALFVGLGIALFDMLPIFGAGAILWPWAVYCLIVGDYSQSIGLMIIYGVVFISRQTLEPRILGKQIGIHPLITLMSIYVGLKVFGTPGLFIGPILAVTVKMIGDMDFDWDNGTCYIS